MCYSINSTVFTFTWPLYLVSFSFFSPRPSFFESLTARIQLPLSFYFTEDYDTSTQDLLRARPMQYLKSCVCILALTFVASGLTQLRNLTVFDDPRISCTLVTPPTLLPRDSLETGLSPVGLSCFAHEDGAARCNREHFPGFGRVLIKQCLEHRRLQQRTILTRGTRSRASNPLGA